MSKDIRCPKCNKSISCYEEKTWEPSRVASTNERPKGAYTGAPMIEVHLRKCKYKIFHDRCIKRFTDKYYGGGGHVVHSTKVKCPLCGATGKLHEVFRSGYDYSN